MDNKKSIALKLEPLSAEAFAPYGDIIQCSENNTIMNINYGLTERHHNLAKIDVSDNSGYPIINIFKTKPISLPFQVKIMERHPHGSQAFMPLTGNPYLVVVAAAGEFDYRNIRAFLAMSDQGVNYHKGTWHHYVMGLNATNQFLVVDRGGNGDNCDELAIDDAIQITVNH